MTEHFAHHQFQRYKFDSVPLNRDVFLMDEKWLADWELTYLEFFEGKEFKNVGYISYATVRSASSEVLEISWYPNIFDRFHEVTVLLPRDAFIECIDVYDYDEKPHIFVTSEWLLRLHLRPYSAFALIDAIGVKRAILNGRLTQNKLLQLRDRIDGLADATPGVAFISVADSLLLKANWYVGQYDSDISYSYEPESLVKLFPLVACIYREVLGMDVYATITQGGNEYADSALIHMSPNNAHVSLNCLGLPFAQLLAIDEAARTSIRSGHHAPCELYIDDLFLHSLRFNYGFDKHALPNNTYIVPMSSEPGKYYYVSARTVLDNLNPSPSTVPRRPK